MATPNTARRIIWPTDPTILVRAVFLYVGQGSSTLILVKNGITYDTWVIDINLDRKNGGIDVPLLVKDLVNGDKIRAFLNTHPHDDHMCGVTQLSDVVAIDEVLHSGHKPSKKYGSCFDELQAVIKKVKKNGGTETVLLGSNSSEATGEAEFHILSPADYVTDEVNEAEADERRRRIHEQCAVVKFGKGDDWIIVTGDADRAAFENHITKYHKENLPSFAMAASHHGSRTFFRENEEDDPYLTALQIIDPECVFVSAPTQEESKHGHPHDDAIELYEDQVGEDNVHHMGAERYSFIIDIYTGGGHSGVTHDDGDLSTDYGLSDEDDGDSGEKSNSAAGPFQRPQSQTGDRTPRKYG